MEKSILLLSVFLVASFSQIFSQEITGTPKDIFSVKKNLLNNTFNNQSSFIKNRRNTKSVYDISDYGDAPVWNWSNDFGGSAADQAKMVDFDEAGNAVVTGYFSGEIFYGNHTLHSTGFNDAFVVKFDPEGNLLWLKQLSASTKDHEIISYAVAVSGNDIYITGYYTGAVILGDFTLPDKNDYNLFFAKLNSNGEIIIAKNIENTTNSIGLTGDKILLNNQNEIYILTQEPYYAAYGSGNPSRLMKLDQNGLVLNTFTTEENIIDFVIRESDIYFTGAINGEGYIGDFYFDPPSYSDAYIAKCNKNLTVEWAWMVEHENNWGDSYASGLFVDNNNDLYFSGNYRINIKLGDFVLFGDGSFLTKLTDTTDFLWAKQVTMRRIKHFISGNNNYLFLSYDNKVLKVSKSTGSFYKKPFDKTINFCTPDKENNHVYLTGNNNGLIYLTKSDNNLNETWNFEIGGDSGNGWVISTETDNKNNIYTYGCATAPMNFFGRNIEEGTFICKQAPDGNVLWLHQFQNLNVKARYGVYTAMDPSFENIFITGSFTESFTLPDGMVLTPGDWGSIFVLEFDTDGNFKNATKFNIPDSNWGGQCISVDNKDNIILSGVFDNAITIGDQVLTSQGSTDAYIIKFNMKNKAVDWALQAGGTNIEYSSLVSTDKNNNIFFTGEFYSEDIHFGDVSTTLEEGDGNIILAEISPEGEVQWLKSVGGSVIQYYDDFNFPTGIAADNNGSFYVKGWHGDSTYFDEHLVTSPNYFSKFIAKFDSTGHCTWISSINETYYGWDFNKMAVDPNNNVYLGMNVRDTIYFGDDYEYVPVGTEDLMLAKYLPDGTLDWVKTMQGNKTSWLSTVSVYDSALTIGGYLTNMLSIGDSNYSAHNKHGFLAQCGKDYTGLQEVYNRKKLSLKIFPNPLIDKSVVEFENNGRTSYKLEIINISGRKVFEMKNIRTNKVTIEKGNLTKGIYLLKLTGEKRYYGKLMVR